MNQGLFSSAGPNPRAGNSMPWVWRCLPAIAISLLVILTVFRADAGTEGKDKSFLAPLASRSLLLDAVKVGKRICAVGERGHLLFSSDEGRTWTQVQTPTRATLTGVTFHDKNLGWAVGHDGVILRTRDGGNRWEKVRNAPDECRPLLDVWFRDDRHGFAIGAYGLCLRTNDGGTRWQEIRISEDDWHLNQMARSTDGRLYIAAEAGQVYRSDDEGATWITLPSPYDGSFFGLLALENNAMMVFGLRGHVFRSDDAGDHWRQVPTDTVATLADGIHLTDGRILLAGLAGTVLVEQDNAFKPIPGPGRLGVWAVVENGKSGFICFGERGATRLALVK